MKKEIAITIAGVLLSPLFLTASSAKVGGAKMFKPCAFSDFNSLSGSLGIGGEAVGSMLSRYTACLPNAGSFCSQ